MTPFRIFEIILFSLLNLIPYALLAIYPLKCQLRFTPVGTAVGVIVAAVARTGFNLWISSDPSRSSFDFPILIFYALFSLLLFKTQFGKSMFTMLMLCNISNFITTAAKCAEGLLFPALAAESFHWSHSLMLVLLQLIILIPLYIYFKKIYAKALQQNVGKAAWRLLWLVPLTFFAVWYRNFHFSAEGYTVLALRPQHTLYTFVINAGAMLIYTMVVQLINEHAENIQLREREYQLNMQRTQYGILHDRIEEARRTTYDSRQHAHVISAYLKDKKYDELEQYMTRYNKTIPDESPMIYCDNYAVNALLQYFAGYAKIIGTGFSSLVQLPNNAGIPDEVLTVVLGNLIENATEACVSEEKGAVISIRGKVDNGAMFFKVVNTCTMPPKTDDEGKYLSHKREGYGIGLRSVQTIVNQYHGMMETGWDEGVFSVSILLNIPEQE